MTNEKILYQINRAEAEAEKTASRDLSIIIDNYSEIFPTIKSTINGLQKKYKKGIFDHVQAVQAFYNIVNYVLSDSFFYRLYSYNKKVVNVPTRYAAAVELLENHMDDIESTEEY